MKQEMDETTNQEAMVIIDHKEDSHPQIIISASTRRRSLANCLIPSARASFNMHEGDKIVAGALMAKDSAQKRERRKRHRGGLPRVVFEARRPKGRGGNLQD